MSHLVGERLGLAGAGTGGDQQCRRRFCITVDAVFDSAALFRVKAVRMPAAIDRLQLHRHVGPVRHTGCGRRK